MQQQNLLEIVPETLFQTHYINDIDQVQKKLQYEIERKREELRAMVGYVLINISQHELNGNFEFYLIVCLVS